jgi:hypothetical protein
MAQLMEKLERAEQRRVQQSQRDTRASDVDAQVLRLENEVLPVPVPFKDKTVSLRFLLKIPKFIVHIHSEVVITPAILR